MLCRTARPSGSQIPARFAGYAALILWTLLLASCAGRSDPPDDSPEQSRIQDTVERQLDLLLDSVAPVGGQALPDDSLLAFYEQRNYRPLWLDNHDALDDLLNQLQRAGEHGLNPVDYHIDALRGYRRLARPDRRQQAEMDVLATMAMQAYAHDLSSGRFDPSLIDTNWQMDLPNGDWKTLLDLESAQQMVDTLPSLAPQHPHYQALQRWLAYYLELDRRGIEIRVPQGELLLRGSNGARVSLLRQRMQQLGDLRGPERPQNPNQFDAALEEAVRNFQSRHGLDADGRVGSQTLAAINVPIAERAEQIRLNLERWRWLPAELEEDRIWVDLTAYEVHMHLHGEHHSMRAVIGKPDRMTRVFRGEMTYMEINPTWRVPQRIAREMLLPQVQQDANYLQRNNYRVFEGWHSGAAEVDPDSVDWLAMRPEDLGYRFEQMPDPGNAMGQYKFMFPNRNAIYLHDTPSQAYFNQADRARSAGCVRLHDPSFFADLLVREDIGARDRLNMARRVDDPTVVSLNEPVPIYLVYFTVMVDSRGLPEFREDIYDRDPLMREAMQYRAFGG
ncbi:MAG: L,D-transpeptidase family protein [Natronospirillum sp.]|uniref:L,D-transpeptidase family protein n=1 Tax=Natronospirillum sp. TaxID=2812955 RepID=UPI0025EB6FA1|nr:L,D-transpeptidase family protein [Natronospirillum sp.]MCH8551144.1 L,D-transpeptidase family protein [Natronospirillum sp.]